VSSVFGSLNMDYVQGHTLNICDHIILNWELQLSSLPLEFQPFCIVLMDSSQTVSDQEDNIRHPDMSKI
jgi:hypothetical protein